MNRPYIGAVRMTKPLEEASYLKTIPAVKFLADGNSLCFQHNVTFIVGENGTGKSTLIEAIAVAYGFNPEGGSKNFNFSTNASHSPLFGHLTLSRQRVAKDGFFLRAESFYNVASNIDELDAVPSFSPPIIESYGGVSLHAQSHGESFLSLIRHRLRGRGIYIFDEPEAALSPMRLLTLLCEIDRLVKRDSQFIIATHSPILMSYPGAEIFELSETGIQSVSYRETEHFRTSQAFYANPERLLENLLSED